MSVNYNAYLPTAKDLAMKDEQAKVFTARKRKEYERVQTEHYSFMHKGGAFNTPFSKLS
jgi:hypothetical protein